MTPDPYESPKGTDELPQPLKPWPLEYGPIIVLVVFGICVVVFGAIAIVSR
jgi:hypothetical protein